MNDVIKSYLVSLGFGVDETSLGKFNKSIQAASTRVLALYGAVKVAAAGIFFSISQISKGFEDMGYEYKMIAPAINKALILRQEMLRAYSAAGVNLSKAVRESVKFNLALTKTQYALKALYTGVASRFFPMLTQQLDNFRKSLYVNMPKINEQLTRFVSGIFKAFEITMILTDRLWQLFTRLYGVLKSLHEATSGWSTGFIAAVAAWKLLNLSFIATPLGAIITGLIVLLALFDDLMTYMEGGDSLFNWEPVIPIIQKIISYFKALGAVFVSIKDVVVALFRVFSKLFAFDLLGFVGELKNLNKALADFLYRVFDVFRKLFDLQTTFAGGIFDLAGWAAEKSGLLGETNPQPLGNLGAASPVNQNVNSQTSIIVQGSADAQSTAKSVSDQQARVNFDLVRNMKANAR